MNKPTHIIIHHTAVKSNKPQFWAVNSYHKSLDFPLSSFRYYVGYHWFIEKNGIAIKARADSDEGAHTLKGWNKKSIGVCMAGDFAQEYPSKAQFASLRSLIQKYKLPYLLHSEADPNRNCPQLSRDMIEGELKSVQDNEDLAKCKAINKELQGTISQLIQWIKSYFNK